MECKRNHPEYVQELQKQVDLALRYFCDAANEKWVSLMLWAGADPRSPGPAPGDPDDPEYYTTAFRQAAYLVTQTREPNCEIELFQEPDLEFENEVKLD